MTSPDREPATVRPDTAAALLARTARAQAEGRAPSVAVGVVRDGALIWSAGRGTVDGAEPTPDTQYRIGSITKGFTAVLVMRLRDEGGLDLEDLLEQHVADTPFGDRTIRDLLAHTAGLAAEPPGPWWERSPGQPWAELAPTFTADHVLGPPGEFHYSNPGYGALGQVITQHRGRSWYEALRDEVLLPLGMTRTTYEPEAPSAPGLAVHPFADVTMPEVVQDLGAMAPAGQLWSTVADLARWASFIAGDTGEVLAASTLAEMRKAKVIAEDQGVYAGYGLGFQVLRRNDRELVGHGGSVPGFLAFIGVDVERGVGFVELANATSGAVFSGIDLLEILQRHEPFVAPPWRPADDVPSELLDAVGIWHWGTSPYLLRVCGSDVLELSAVSGPGRGSRFLRSEDGDWVGTGNYWRGETLRVLRHADGSVSHLDLATFVLTRTPYDPTAPVPGGVPDQPWSPLASGHEGEHR